MLHTVNAAAVLQTSAADSIAVAGVCACWCILQRAQQEPPTPTTAGSKGTPTTAKSCPGCCCDSFIHLRHSMRPEDLLLTPPCLNCRWNTGTKTCGKASLLAFTVARPVDITEMGARKRAAAVTQVAEASWIYKYGAKKASDIGGARWIAQVRRRAAWPCIFHCLIILHRSRTTKGHVRQIIPDLPCLTSSRRCCCRLTLRSDVICHTLVIKHKKLTTSAVA